MKEVLRGEPLSLCLSKSFTRYAPQSFRNSLFKSGAILVSRTKEMQALQKKKVSGKE